MPFGAAPNSYVTMAVCLLVIGVSGYFLLLWRRRHCGGGVGSP
ncbi:MAG: hypothetical protein V8R75_05480 [Oscillospiraceae bacterium]